jgi:hypothetical protein
MSMHEFEGAQLQVEERHRVEHPGTWLRLPCCEGSVHPVHILSQTRDQVVITAPSDPHPEWIRQPEPNTVLTLGWTDAGGTLVLDCTIPSDGVGVTEWALDIVNKQGFLQRRRFIRVSADALFKLTDGDSQRIISGSVLDISEIGMRCLFEDCALPMHSQLHQFALQLENTVLPVTCELRWAGRTGPLETQAGFEFIDTSDSVRARLRAYVMLQLDRRGPLEE